MAKALNVSLAVTADIGQAKQQLQQLQQTLSQLTANSANLKINLDTSSIAKASASVDQLAIHLKNATNIDTGLLDFGKLNTSIKSSGHTLQEYGKQLLSLGPQGQQAFSQLTQAIAKSEIPINKLKSLFGNFGTVLSNTIRWQASSSIIHGMMGTIQGAYGYAQDLNKSLTDIQIVTQASDEHMAKFAEQANKAAKALSTTTTAYTKASLIYYQQGLNDQQVKERTDVTVKMANVTGQSAQEVSDQMTAIWNNFAKGSQNLEYYADVITALGAATASSSEEISRGLEKFAAIADTVGLSYENATAALATITATTRQSADTVGTGLRTLFSRLQSLSLGETLEDGVDLTKYSKALKTIGVDVLDASGNLREMDDILEDMGNQWDKLTDAQKTAVAQTVGGVRQYTTLMALMENFDFYKQNQQVAKNSEGTVQAQADIYAKSWEAAQKRMRAASESLYSDLINDQFFISLTNGFSGVLNIIDAIIDGLGGMKTILPAIAALLTNVFSGQIANGMINFATTIKSLSPKVAAQNDRDRTAFLENSARLMAGLSETQTPNAQQKIQLGYAQKEIAMQQAYLMNQGVMTQFEKQYAQQQMDKFSNLRQQQFQQQNKVNQNVDLLRNARTGVVQSMREANPWLQTATKETVKSYYEDFGKAMDENLLEPLSKVEKQKNILKDWADTSDEGISKLKQTLTDNGMKDAGSAVSAMIENNQIDETERNKLLESLNNQQIEQVNKFASDWDLNTNAVMKYRDAIIAAQGDEAKLNEIARQIKQTEEEAANAVSRRNKTIERVQAVTGIAQGAMSLASTANATTSIVDNISTIAQGEGTISNFTGVLTSMGMAALTAMTGFKALKTGIEALGGSIGAAAGPIGLVITIASIAIPLLIKTYEALRPETNEEKIQRLSELADQAQTAAQESKQAYDNLLSNVSSHNELLNEINSLTEGTKEFTDALQEANIIASGLISTYGLQLGKDYTFEDGKIVFNEDSIKTITTAAQDWSYLQEFIADLAQYQSSSTSDSAERETQRYTRTYDWADTHSDEAEFIRQVQNSLRRDFDNMYWDNEENFKEKGIDYGTFISNTNLYQHSMDEIQSYLDGLDFISGWTNEHELNKNNILSTTLDNYWSGIWGRYDWSSDGVVGEKYSGWEDLLTRRETDINPSMENTLANPTFGRDQYTQILTSIANFQDGISDAEGFAIEALTDSFNTDEFDKMMLNFEEADDLDFANIADAKSKFIEELSAEQLKLLENDKEYQELDTEDKIQKLKDTIILNRKRKAIEEQFASQVAQFKNANILNKYADLENYTLSELSEINADKLNSAETNQLEKLQNSYRERIKEVANQVLKTAFGEDAEFNPEDWDITAKDWLKAQDIFSSFSDLFKKDLEDTSFSQKIGELLFNESTKQINQGLLSALSSVDTSSNLSALLDLKRYSDFSQFSGISNELKQLYETGLEAIGGKAGILKELYGTEEFQDSLKELQKAFKKTGKLSAKDIMEAADSCGILNDYLKYGDQSASALAAAIELMGTGGASSIDQISDAFLDAMGAAGAFEDQLYNVFKFIDEFSPDRSIQDIADFFSQTSDDMFTELGSGNYGGERLYQEAAAIWGDAYASHLKNFFIEQQTEALDKDLGPLALQKAYQEQFQAFDKVMQTVAKEGNMRAYWDFLLKGGGDQILGQEVGGEYGYSNVENENHERLKISEALREHAGITNIGKNGDIEADLQGRTTEMFTQDVADALGISYDEAAVRVQEMSGKSAALTHDLKRNDAAAGLLALGQGHEKITRVSNGQSQYGITATSIEEGFNEMSWAEQTAFLQKYGDVLTEVDTETGTHLAQLNEQRQAERDEVATLRASSDARTEMNQSIADAVAAHENLITTTEVNGKTYTDFGQTMSNLTSAGYTQQEVLQAVADGAIDLGDAAYIAEDAFGNKLSVAIRDANGDLKDMETIMSEAEIAVHDSNIAHDAEIQAKAFMNAFAGATIEPIDVTVNVNGQESVSTLQESLGVLEDKNVNINISENGTAEKVQGLIDGIIGKDIEISINGVDNVTSLIDSIIKDNSGKSITIDLNGAGETSATGGYVPFGSHAMGTGPVQSHKLRPGISLTGEEGKEIVWNKEKGYSYIVGEKHPEFVTLYPGDRVFNAQETAEILGSSALGGKVYESNADSAYGGGVGPKGKYGGSSSGKAKDSTLERYHVIKRQIQDLEFWYQELEKARENAYGTNVLEAIDNEIKATDELLKAQQALVQEAEDFKNKDLVKLQDLSEKYGFQLELDGNGNIANWDDLQDKYAAAAQNKDETAKEIWDAIKQYEDSIDEWQADFSKMVDLQLQKAELQLERITEKHEMKIDFDEREIKLLDHYIERIDDNIYHTAKVLALTEEKLGHINQKIEDTKEGIDDLFTELSDSQGNKIIKADGTAYTLNEWLALTNEERDLLDINGKFGEQLEEYMDNLLDYIEELEDFKTKGVEEFSDAFNELNDNVRSSIDLFDHYNQLLSSLKNITDLQGVKLSTEMRAARKEIDQIMFQNTQNNIQAENENYKRLVSEVEDLRMKIADTQDETLKKAWEEQLKTAEEQLRASEQNMLSLWETGLDQAKNMFEQALQDAVDAYESAIAGMYGTVDELEKAWDQQKKNDDFYVKDFEKYYQIQKLQRSITKDLDAAARAGNKQNQGLKKLYEDLNAAREDGVELSSYDLDIYAKRYEYEKALMELEDARNNKNEVRLQRDANGNWGYIYTSTADEDDLIAKQQAVDDKFYELQKATQERVASLSDDLMSEIASVGKRLQELRSSGASQDTIDKYLEQEKLYLENYEKGLAKALEDAGMTEEEARSRYGDAGFDILNDFQETLFSAITGGDEGLDEFFKRVSEAVTNADSQMVQAGSEYQKQVSAIDKWFNESGEDLAKVIQGFTTLVGEESSGTLLDSKEQIDNVKQTFTDILQVARDFEKEFMTIYQPIIDANEQLVADLLEALHALNREEYEGPEHNKSTIADIQSNNTMTRMATGGYTGSWGPEGRMAILDEKELVLNKDDTKNFLNATAILRTIDLQTGLFSKGLGNIITPFIADMQQGVLDQNVHIDATFPNVTDHNEIEAAFDNLINKASQYANRKNMSSMTFNDMYISRF